MVLLIYFCMAPGQEPNPTSRFFGVWKKPAVCGAAAQLGPGLQGQFAGERSCQLWAEHQEAGAGSWAATQDREQHIFDSTGQGCSDDYYKDHGVGRWGYAGGV